MESKVIFSFSDECQLACPMVSSLVHAGFPSSADDYVETSLDLNSHLIQHPAATFFVKVEGDSMVDGNIHPGDILVVDRALSPSNGKVVIAVVDGEFTVKRLCYKSRSTWLVADNPSYPPISVEKHQDCQIWGVVTYVIHKT